MRPHVPAAVEATAVVVAEALIAVPMAAIIAAITAIPIAVVSIVTAIPIAIIVTLMTIAVAVVSLRGGDHAADERERQSRSSNEAFHFDLPNTHRTNRPGAHYRTSGLIPY